MSRPTVWDHIHRSVITSAYCTQSKIHLILWSLCLLSVIFNVSGVSKGHSLTLLIEIVLVVEILWLCSYLHNWKDVKKCSLCSWALCFSNTPAAVSTTIWNISLFHCFCMFLTLDQNSSHGLCFQPEPIPYTQECQASFTFLLWVFLAKIRYHCLIKRFSIIIPDILVITQVKQIKQKF